MRSVRAAAGALVALVTLWSVSEHQPEDVDRWLTAATATFVVPQAEIAATATAATAALSAAPDVASTPVPRPPQTDLPLAQATVGPEGVDSTKGSTAIAAAATPPTEFVKPVEGAAPAPMPAAGVAAPLATNGANLRVPPVRRVRPQQASRRAARTVTARSETCAGRPLGARGTDHAKGFPRPQAHLDPVAAGAVTG